MTIVWSSLDEMAQNTDCRDEGVPEICKVRNERNECPGSPRFTLRFSVLILKSVKCSNKAILSNASGLAHAPHEPMFSVRRCRKRDIPDVAEEVSGPSIPRYSRVRAEEDSEFRMVPSSRFSTPPICMPSWQSMDPTYL